MDKQVTPLMTIPIWLYGEGIKEEDEEEEEEVEEEEEAEAEEAEEEEVVIFVVPTLYKDTPKLHYTIHT